MLAKVRKLLVWLNLNSAYTCVYAPQTEEEEEEEEDDMPAPMTIAGNTM